MALMRRSPLAVLAALCLAAALAPAAPGRAEGPAPAPDPVAEQRKALDTARESLKDTQERRQRIAAEVDALKGESGKLQAALVVAAEKVRVLAPKVEERAGKLGELGESERQLKTSLVARRGVLGKVIAALQRMGRQPPPALLVRPDDALEAIRSAILLGAVVPEMRAEAEALGSDLREMTRVKGMIGQERDGFVREVGELDAERERITALIDERQKTLGRRQSDLAAEADRAGALARDVVDLEGLLARVEKEQAAAPPPTAAGGQDPSVAMLREAARLAPSLPFEQARGLLQVPAGGRRLTAYGQASDVAMSREGMTFSTEPGALVTAPSDGRVAYLGHFRSYGQLLILNVGDGYHVILSGMDRITVALNQSVLAGEPVGVMKAAGSGAISASRASRPVLYVEFRNGRGSIDPSPWWADARSEKVGG